MKFINNSFYSADSSKSLNKFYHVSSLAFVGLVPVAIVTGPSYFSSVLDVILGVAFPIHGHVALNYVISDYVPKASRAVARVGLTGFTVVTLAGLLRLNLSGPGLTETLKAMWKNKTSKL